jgi:tRNA threonylcarbamoyladenosine biosynthesis protein TsaB
MNVLAIDTSNQTMSVALVDESGLIAEYTTNVKKNHSVRLMPAIHSIMKEAGLVPSDLDKVVVAVGPGSFTGVRIGVTTAKTLSWSLNIPVVAVSSLELVAYNGLYFKGKICPFFDARRGRVYTGLYVSNGVTVDNVKSDQNLLFADWLKELEEQDEKVLFLSTDLDIHKETIQDILGDKAVYPENYFPYPRAAVLGTIGLKIDPVENVHDLVPEYLRLVEAEAKWLETQKKESNNE